MIGRPVDTILPMISLLAVSTVRFIPALNIITSSLTSIRIRQFSVDLIVDLIKKQIYFLEKKNQKKFIKKILAKIKFLVII